MSTEETITIFAFTPGPSWPTPTGGPFANKLVAWMRLTGIPYEIKFEDNASKGPKYKSPWIEVDGELMGDSELIIQMLSNKFNKTLEADLTPSQAGQAIALRRLVEEHLHQVADYELIIHDEGYKMFRTMIKSTTPPIIASLLLMYLKYHFRKQLYARGIMRHSAQDITRMAKDDIDALAGILGDRDWFISDTPTLADLAVYGQLSFFVFCGIKAPTCMYVHTKPNLVMWTKKVNDMVMKGSHQ
eukprot:CAMPEP_0174700424 /NCGR_PEP_ID=MMETSP1094-20130205/5373_1 /TAXON_ID=156173 /ORGANISM="Chrysochromulina brevifilum, Strain UTEX LB 985" /LENGTH=243 /DNA_ID=CAMNT_0015897899 /DNA_START=74 /DNA_END=805 /DNA_ORIENTATION=+